jgi:hypothetical protein
MGKKAQQKRVDPLHTNTEILQEEPRLIQGVRYGFQLLCVRIGKYSVLIIYSEEGLSWIIAVQPFTCLQEGFTRSVFIYHYAVVGRLCFFLEDMPLAIVRW